MDKVIFRTWKDSGDVIALFPEISADYAGHHCLSFQHVGQHSAADYGIVLSRTRPSRASECTGLLHELEQRGYKPGTRKRESPAMREARRLRTEYPDP